MSSFTEPDPSFHSPVRAKCLLHSTDSGGVAAGGSHSDLALPSWDCDDDHRHGADNDDHFRQEYGPYEPASPEPPFVRVASTLTTSTVSSRISQSAVDILLEMDDSEDEYHNPHSSSDGIMKPESATAADLENGPEPSDDHVVVSTEIGNMGILRRKTNITWCRFCGYSNLCLLLMLGLLGLLFGVLHGTNQDCFQNGRCRSQPTTTSRYIPPPEPSAEYLKVTCSNWWNQNPAHARQYAYDTCHGMCDMAPCCWQPDTNATTTNNSGNSSNATQGLSSCRVDPACRDYDSCTELWQIQADAPNSQQQQPASSTLSGMETQVQEEPTTSASSTTMPPVVHNDEEDAIDGSINDVSTTTNNVNSDSSTATNNGNSVVNATADQILMACFGTNEETTTKLYSPDECQRVCQRGMCCFYPEVAVPATCPDQVAVDCVKYEPCSVLGLEFLLQIQQDDTANSTEASQP